MNINTHSLTPQEIVDAAASVRERTRAFVKERMRAEDEAIKAERERVQAACLRSTGHVFGVAPSFYGADYRACVYCGAVPNKASARTDPMERCESDV
jgi:hypothetical protein